MSRATPPGGISGVECPECGSIRTRSRATGYSHDNDRVRQRVCADCAYRFITVEMAIPQRVTWGSLVPYARDHDRRAGHLKFGWKSRPEWLRPIVQLVIDIRAVERPAKDRERAA